MIEVGVDGESVTVTVTGDIDIADEEELRYALYEAVAAEPAELVVDIRAAGVFGSTGVNALVWSWHALGNATTRLRIIPGGYQSRRVLEILRVGELDRVSIAA